MGRLCIECRMYCDNDSNKHFKALRQAIMIQHVECVKTLVEGGADVKHKIYYCGGIMTLLEAAVRNGNVEIVKLLIGAGADVNTGSIEPLLVLAVKYGHTEILKALIDAGADVNSATIKPILVTAVQYGNVDVVKALIDAGADVNLRSDLIQDSPLATAVSHKKTECLKMLLDAGADVNHVHNKVALMITAMHGNVQGMSLLIDAGADVNHKYNNSKSALFLAAENFHTTCMKLLIKKGAEVTCVKDSVPHCLNHLSPRHQKAMGKPYWLLLAAGVDSPFLNLLFPKASLIYPPQEEMSLMHQCRQLIRKHLLQMSPVNLFVQVPQLELPTLLQEYLLFNAALDDNDDDDDGDHDNDDDDDDDDDGDHDNDDDDDDDDDDKYFTHYGKLIVS